MVAMPVVATNLRDLVQVLWSPAGATIPSLGDLTLVDVHNGNTPSVRMSVRMPRSPRSRPTVR
jgi:hypothetical protein